MNQITAIALWMVGLVLRLAVGRRLKPAHKVFVLIYLILNIPLSVAFLVRSFDLMPAGIVHLPECVLAWIILSTLVMFLVPIRLILIPNAFVLGLIFSLIGGFGLVEAGIESTKPIYELLVFAIFLLLVSVFCLFRLRQWWHS